MQEGQADSTWGIMRLLIKEHKIFVISGVVIGLAVVMILPPLGILLIAGPLGYLYLQAQGKFMSYFAAAHGMTYAKAGRMEECRGKLFEVGHSRAVSNVVSGQWNGFPVRIFNYTYVTGGGKHSSTHAFTVLEIRFQNLEFPYIFLRSKSMWQNWSGLFGGEEEISINESRFRLFVAKGYHIEALQIFSEQLLAFLAENAADFSIEFSRDRLNIYDDKTIGNKTDITKLLNAGKHIIDSSGGFIMRLRDDFAALHPYYSKPGH